jgi:hypothetical protein
MDRPTGEQAVDPVDPSGAGPVCLSEPGAGLGAGLHAPRSTWTVQASQQAQVYCAMAQFNAAMNEAASLYYSRLDNMAMVTICVLTVITGGQSIPHILDVASGAATSSTRSTSWVNIFISLCEIALGAIAGVVARLDWRQRSQACAARAVGYARLAASVRLELTLAPAERGAARTVLEHIEQTIGTLEAAAPPLPLRYRTEAKLEQSILSMWGDSRSTASLPLSASAGAAAHSAVAPRVPFGARNVPGLVVEEGDMGALRSTSTSSPEGDTVHEDMFLDPKKLASAVWRQMVRAP